MKFLLLQIYFIAFLLVMTLNNTAYCQIQLKAWTATDASEVITPYAVADPLFSMNTEDIFRRFDTGASEFYEKVSDMSIKRLYYPGGSLSRLYHHYSNFSGGNDYVYGYQTNPWEDLMEGQDDLYGYISNDDSEHFIFDFVTLCENSSADVILSVNILYGNICELDDLLAYFEANFLNQKVDIVILTTEVHLGDDRDLIPNISTYYEKIKPFLDYLKNQIHYPGVKVSLDVAPDNVYGTSTNEVFNQDWNEGISQIKNSVAYGPMNLSGTINWWWYPKDPLIGYTGCSCATPCSHPSAGTNWTTYFDHGLADALDFTNSSVPDIADYYQSKGIDAMNISQWGIKDFLAPCSNNTFYGTGDYKEAAFYNSMLQAIFMTKFLMKLIDYNFLNGEFFKSANYFDVATNKKDRDPLYTKTADELNVNVSTSVAYILYKEILSKSRGLYWQATNSSLDPAVDQFYFESDGDSYFVLINEHSSTITLNYQAIVNTTSGAILKPFQSIKTLSSLNSSLWGWHQDGLNSNHPSFLPATVNDAIPSTLSDLILNGQIYTVPANSITIIQLVP